MSTPGNPIPISIFDPWISSDGISILGSCKLRPSNPFSPPIFGSWISYPIPEAWIFGFLK